MSKVTYNEFAIKWRTQIDVDYFSQFAKTWIAVNAWYKMTYPTLKKDRESIEEIKNAPNTFRNRIISLLNDSLDDENVRFKYHIGLLHKELERTHIYNNDNRITFEAVIIGSNSTKVFSVNKFGINYRVECTYVGNKLNVVNCDISRSGSSFFSSVENVYDFTLVTSNTDYNLLSDTQKSWLEHCYKEVNPKKATNLLTKDETHIKIGQFNFITDKEIIAKALIEVIYLIRNSLFHGSIIPDKDTNRIYEQAYQILKLITLVL